MTTPALVIAGDKGQNPRFPDREAGAPTPTTSAPAPKSLLTIFGSEHGLGGVPMWDAEETTDENPERVAAVRALTWAYLHTTLYRSDPAWPDAIAALESQPDSLGKVESK